MNNDINQALKPKFIEATKDDILSVLKNVKASLNDRNSKELAEWSNHLVHTTSINNEPRAMYVSIIAYALSKLVEKESSLGKYENEWEEFLEGTEANIGAAVIFLEKNDIKKFDNAIKSILKLISEFDVLFSKYVQKVLEFSSIQKGEKVYEHGLSASRVAKMLGISQWDLMQKIGETKAHEHGSFATKTTRERYEQLKRIMKK